MLLPIKRFGEMHVRATVVKLVMSVWPTFDATGHYETSLCNFSVTLNVDRHSPAGLSAFMLALDPRLVADTSAHVDDISYTLLDPRNPLTYSTVGHYRKHVGEGVLDLYDDVPNVRVESASTIRTLSTVPEPIAVLRVDLQQPAAPDETVAVRFWLPMKNVFAPTPDGALYFSLPVQDDTVIAKIVGEDQAHAMSLPIVTVGDDGIAGGLDIFLYMPLDYEGERFTVEPSVGLLPHYDHLGRDTALPFRKWAWPGRSFGPVPGSIMRLGDRAIVAGVFRRRSNQVDRAIYISGNSGPVLVGSPVTNSSMAGSSGIAANDFESKDALSLVDAIRCLIEDSAAAVPGDLITTHVTKLEDAIRERDRPSARKYAATLGKIATTTLDRGPALIDLIDQLSRHL